ncbi:YceI family protein [Salegentibacter sp.]|uniref:YceI family protein n=1 Tax=Salegentibacter sp. TaxID=1903072 RepID=UPI003566C534
MRSSISIALVLFLFVLGTAQSQNFKMQSSSDIKVEGTSNIHDWELNAEKKSGSAVLESEDGKITGLQSLQATIPAESLKSGKGGMDKNTYKALNTDKHKNIEFKLDEVKDFQDTGNGTYNVKGVGTLKIAGVSKQIPLDFTMKVDANSIKISGEKPLNMTDFKIDPPTAMFGTITTGEDVIIKFNTNFTK